jgi:hypothetical protein
MHRVDSTIYIENTLITGLLHRDGKNKEKMKPNVKEDTVVERVKMYVAHDMVFFSDLLLKCFSICINFSV